jgi:CRISPR-associated endonuclease Csn1
MKNGASRRYRLGIDAGSNSLGRFVVWLNDNDEPTGLGPGGVRIFPDGRDPKSKESNAADRRVARGMRRRRDRYLQRRGNLLALLVKHGLMPAEEAARKALEQLDPYELRAKALDQTLPPYHIGRALFHLNQRRGFLSNRKTEKGDKESGAIKVAAGNLQNSMQESGARTIGEFFHRRHLVREPVRTRNNSSGAKAEYDFYPTRQMLIDEYRAIWTRQAPHCATMTADACEAIYHAIFFQRPLKQPPVGKCSLDPATDADDLDGFRCSWAHPLAQRFRIWQEVRNLAVHETGRPSRPISKEEGDRIALALFLLRQDTDPVEAAGGSEVQSGKRKAQSSARRRDGRETVPQVVLRQGVAKPPARPAARYRCPARKHRSRQGTYHVAHGK